MSRSYEINKGGGVIAEITVGDDECQIIDHEVRQATESLRAQLSESAVREVALRTIAERALIVFEPKPGQGLNKEGRYSSIVAAINAVTSAPPSAAAAELTALRDLERAAISDQCRRCKDGEPKRVQNDSEGRPTVYHLYSACDTPQLSDALAAIAQSRSAKP